MTKDTFYPGFDDENEDRDKTLKDELGETIDKEVPNATVSISSWFLTAFCLLHLYPQSVLLLFRTRRQSSLKQ